MITMTNEKEAQYVTHSGPFHADDVMATVLLEILHDDIKVARVNEWDNEDESIFAYDVGLGKYDHHQEDKARRENGIAYSSVGLIWRDFGYDILKKLGKSDRLDDYFYDIDDYLILPIDAMDNGEGKRIPATVTSVISMMNPFWNSAKSTDDIFLEAVNFARVVFDALVYSFDKEYAGNEVDWDAGYDWLDTVLKDLVLEEANKAGCFVYNEEGNNLDMWDEYGEEIMLYNKTPKIHVEKGAHGVKKMFLDPLSYDRPEYEELTSYPIEMIAIIEEERNKSGKAILKDILERCIISESSRLQGMDYVENRIDLSENHILILEEFAPWKGAVLKSESPKARDIFLVIFPSQRGGWNFQGIPLSPESFDVRIKVPEAWLGKRDEELVELTGIKDARFIHPGGFIGGTDSYESTLALAQKIVEYTLNATL